MSWLVETDRCDWSTCREPATLTLPTLGYGPLAADTFWCAEHFDLVIRTRRPLDPSNDS